MRGIGTRVVVVLAAAALTLSACSSSKKTVAANTPATTPVTSSTPAATTPAATGGGGGGGAAGCAQLIAARDKLGTIAQSLQNPTSAKQGIQNIVTELNALKSVAPSQIQPQVTELINDFTQEEGLIDNPQVNAQQIAAVSQKEATAGQAIASYVESSCK